MEGLAQGVLGVEVHGGLAADGGQVVAHPGVPLPLHQLFPGSGLDLHRVHVGVQVVNGGVLGQQSHGGFLADALDPGDVVRGIPHEGLQVDDVDGVEAVLLPKHLRGHVAGGGAAHTGGHQLDGGGVGDKLQGVLVSGDHHGLAALLPVHPGHGAQQVVGLPALQLIAADVHGVQQPFQHRHLHRQLLGHALALGLVALIGQVAEGGRLQIEGHRQPLRLFLLQQLQEDVDKAENGVGGQALPGGQILTDPVKGPVDDGVSVDDHELHSVALLPWCGVLR